jgi:excisionase family DNA binding protein
MNREPVNPNDLLNVPELAALLRCSARTVQNLFAAGDLPVVRIGRRVFVRRADVAKFLRARRSK